MTAKITVKNNGSIRVEGDFEIFDANGAKFDLAGRQHISLCRCGQTLKQPFCDGQHNKCSFQSTVVAFALEPKP